MFSQLCTLTMMSSILNMFSFYVIKTELTSQHQIMAIHHIDIQSNSKYQKTFRSLKKNLNNTGKIKDLRNCQTSK